jgi:hypothetical protein
MGVVYRAYHSQLERTGAVKVLQGLAPDADSVARFRREAQAIAHMRHPNVVNVFDFGEFEGTPYMIVEFVAGGSLAARLGSPLGADETLSYLRGIADALDYAHSLGIVHRDVKPANVLIGPENAPILADFGLVKLMQSSSVKSMTGLTTGTPAYMAPEQVTGTQVGPAADRYSLAVIAYEMLTGSYPFNEGGVLEVLYAHVHREPPSPSSRNDRLGPRVDAVILRGLAKDPRARFESCEAFVVALENALKEQPAPATEVGSPPMYAAQAVGAAVAVALPAALTATTAVAERPAPAPVNGSVAVPMPERAQPRKKQRRTRQVIGASVLILLLLIGGVFVFDVLRPPILDIKPNIAARGDDVTVTAVHVPRNQQGQIWLESVLHRYNFQADGSGNVKVRFAVPFDIAIGDHTVCISWNGTCHAQQTLHVVASVAFVPSPSPGMSPTPGASPTPGSTPSPRPTPGHSPSPGHSPTPRPTPSPSPRPTPTPNPSIALVSISSLGNTTVTFHYFYGGSATITIHQGTTTKSVTVSVSAGANTTVTFKTPAGFVVTAPLVAPQAFVTVGSLASNSVNVTL